MTSCPRRARCQAGPGGTFCPTSGITPAPSAVSRTGLRLECRLRCTRDPLPGRRRSHSARSGTLSARSRIILPGRSDSVGCSEIKRLASMEALFVRGSLAHQVIGKRTDRLRDTENVRFLLLVVIIALVVLMILQFPGASFVAS